MNTSGSMMSDFYPCPPRGGRLTPDGIFGEGTEFLSTPSARRATSASARPAPTRTNFYPRPPRGGRLVINHTVSLMIIFLSTPSARRATLHRGQVRVHQLQISIHALREEGDLADKGLISMYREFLSTPSARRATATASFSCQPCCHFYPRPPRGGRRWRLFGSQHKRPISIHALREEGDDLQDIRNKGEKIFLSTPSARRATRKLPQLDKAKTISIHALREEGDGDRFLLRHIAGISIHALREEGDDR